MNTKITIASAAILLASVSGAFASEAFDVDIYRPAMAQSQGYEAYAQAPRGHQAQAERSQATQQDANSLAAQNSYWGHGSEIN
jgi:hypothetical protein